jgi:hypothetical protein
MPAGLLIQDASGNVVLDTTTSLGRHTGTQEIGVSPTFTGTISVPGYASPATVWFMSTFSITLGHPPTIYDFGEGFFSVSGGDITWEAYGTQKILYGVY